MEVCAFLIEFVVFFIRVLWCIIQAGLKWIVPKKYKDITGDVVLITGGGRGIGRQLAVEFAKHNPKQIILWGRHEDTLAATAKAVALKNTSCDYMICDVSDREKVYKKASELKKRYGNVTILVNNAGVISGNTFLETNEEDLQKTIEVNTLAHCWTYKAFLPSMLKYDHGHIVSINSILAMMGLSGAADYCTSKFATLGLTESVMLEIHRQGKTGVHMTSVHPYMVNTEMFAGCTTRFPFLFPALDLDYVAWKVVDAVLTNQQMVIMPKIMYFLYWIKSVLPVDAYMITQRFSGVDKTMENFHGRKRKTYLEMESSS